MLICGQNLIHVLTLYLNVERCEISTFVLGVIFTSNFVK